MSNLFVPFPSDEPHQMRGDTLVLPAVSMANVGQLACDLLLNQLYVSCSEVSPSSHAISSISLLPLHCLTQSRLSCHTTPQTLQVDRVGCLRTPHVLPVAGCNALDTADPAQVCTNVEVLRVREKQLTIVQQRAPVLAGHARAYVKELCQWIADVGFSRVIMLAGADANGRTDQQIVK
jgi:hypothetical protein